MREQQQLDGITESIIRGAIEVHSVLGRRLFASFSGCWLLVRRYHAGGSRWVRSGLILLMLCKTRRQLHQHKNHHLSSLGVDCLGLRARRGNAEPNISLLPWAAHEANYAETARAESINITKSRAEYSFG